MRMGLAKWMKEDDFAAWSAQQLNRPVATGGKTFVADDEVPTAVVFPYGDPWIFLGIASHELLELSRFERERYGPQPDDVRSMNGMVLADEYVVERARTAITQRLQWPESPIDASPGMVEQTDDLRAVLNPTRQGRPTVEFWQHWVNIGRVFAMVAGRADGGSTSAAAELAAWAEHAFITDGGWSPIRAALNGLYQQPSLDREVFVDAAARRIWAPLEAYGRAVWPSPLGRP